MSNVVSRKCEAVAHDVGAWAMESDAESAWRPQLNSAVVTWKLCGSLVRPAHSSLLQCAALRRC
jgi:hypothetical protein